jgi:MFS family permease
MTDDDNFLVFAAIGGMLLVAGGLYRPLAKRLSETQLLTTGLASLIAGMAGIGVVAWLVHREHGAGLEVAPLTRWLFYAASAAAVAGFAFINPSVSALISKRADPARQGEVLGVNQSFASLGRILGPFAGSMLFGLHPSRTLPYVAAVAALLVVATLLPRVSRTQE